MNSKIKFQILFLIFLFQSTVCQEEDEYDEEEAEGDVEVAATTEPTSTTKKVDPLLNLNFTEQFQLLVSEVDNANATTVVNLNETLTNGSSTTTRRPAVRTTPVPRGQVIGSGVHGILSSITSLDIPGIVDSALRIRTNDQNDNVREYVMGIMKGVFCSPVLSVFSSCGNGAAGEEAAASPATAAGVASAPA